MNRRDETASIVGEELADALEREKEVRLATAIALHDWGRTPIIYSGPSDDLEIIQTDRLPAAFECEYCGTAYVVDLISREIDCPGCGHPPPYDQLAAVLSPPLFRDTAMEYRGKTWEDAGMITGSAVALRFGDSALISGSVQTYASWQGANNLVERCRIDGKAPAVGETGLCRFHGGGSSVYGHPITHENREAIRGAHPETSDFIND